MLDVMLPVISDDFMKFLSLRYVNDAERVRSTDYI